MSEWDGYDEWTEDEEWEWESDDPCENCGPGCPDWGGDGLCMVEIRAQSLMHEYYEAHHVRKSRCPVCGQELTEYDIYAGGEKRPWVWSAGWFHPILGIEVMGALWLNKGIVHSMDDVHHVWIEWGTGREDRLLRYIGDEENEKAMAGLQEHMTTKQR